MVLPLPRTPGASEKNYTYLAADLLTGRVIAELPLGGVTYGKRLNDAGALNGTFSFDVKSTPLLRPATAPARTALHVFRDGQAVWGGIIWARTIDHNARTCALQCADFWSYFDHRRLLSALSFTGVDQNAIARALVTAAQAATGGNLTVTTPVTTSGTTRTLDYKPWSLATFAQLLTDLASLEDGPDLAFDVAGTTDAVTRQLLVGTPRLGRDAATAGIVLDYGRPGAALDSLVETEDGTTAETTHIALGPGTEAGQLSAEATREDLIAAGWPLLEGTSTYSDDSVGQNTITEYATADLAAAAGIKVTFTGSTRKVPVGSFQLGDEVTLDVDSAWLNTEPRAGDEVIVPAPYGSAAYGEGPYGVGPFGEGTGDPGGVATSYVAQPSQRRTETTRITGFTVNVPDDGSAESVSFEFGQLLRSA